MEHLVVGVDGSAGADRALRWAAAEARLWNARLSIAHCYPTDPDDRVWGAQQEHAGRALLDEVTARAASVLDGVRWDTALEWAPSGSAAYKLVDLADDADLLVVGSRGLGGFLQLLLGSVSHQVSTHARGSVVVVRDGAAQAHTDGGVVVGVDGSQPSLTALRWAAREAARRGVGLTAAIAYATPAAYVAAARGLNTHDLDQYRAQAREVAVDRLAAAVANASLPSDVHVEQVVAAGSPAGVLVRLAHANQLLVTGPRGRGAVTQAVLGSVSDQCLRHSASPVAVVRDRRAH